MVDEARARAAIAEALPGSTIEDGIRYHDLYLYRVLIPSANEQNYDPFFSVDSVTGEVRDFDIMNDGDITEIAELFDESGRGNGNV